MKFNKFKKDCDQTNMLDLIKINTENNKENILKISKIIEHINISTSKKRKQESLAEDKFNLYL